MENKGAKFVGYRFAELIKWLGFIKAKEIVEGQAFFVEYRSSIFAIGLQNYRQEIYVTLYRDEFDGPGVNLFNLLSYLNQDSPNAPEEKYFEEEKKLEERYERQLIYISEIIHEYLPVIADFFKSSDLERKLLDITQFMISRNPNLFKKM